MGHKSVNPGFFFLENWQSAESWYRWNNTLLVYSTCFFYSLPSKHHPSQHVVVSCIHDIQIHLYRCEKKRCSRLFLLRLINIDNYSVFSIFKPSSNLFVLKKKNYIFFLIYVYTYLNKINTFTVRNYYTSWYRCLGILIRQIFF